MKTNFYIITPTYNRSNLVKRCVSSVLSQKYQNWKMCIVNDSPEADYTDLEILLQEKKDSRIHYVKNSQNKGSNFCKNFSLENIPLNSDFVIFLDDDDYLSENALEELADAIGKADESKKYKWFVSNRVKENNEPITKNNTRKENVDYFWNYLLKKDFSGDATHCISTDIAKKSSFSKIIKNGEEVIFFLSVCKYVKKFKYLNLNTTISGGYLQGGLTQETREKYGENAQKLLREYSFHLGWKTLIYLYLRNLYAKIRLLSNKS